MTAYRKKPVTIEAWRVNDLLIAAEVQWSDLPEPVAEAYERGEIVFGSHVMSVRTLEGTMEGGREDFLIRGVQGELYPCKPDIFAATYDPAAVTAGHRDRDEQARYERAQARFFTASDHPPVVALRDQIIGLGMLIDQHVPAGRNQALALTALEDVQMRGNRGIFAPEGLR